MAKTNVKFLIIFVVCFLVSMGSLEIPAARPAIDAASRWLVKVSFLAVTTCGGAASIAGDNRTVLLHPTGFGVEMKDGCNGINVTFLLWSAILAFPSTWKRKLQGLLLGTAAIQGINIIRFISLYYLIRINRPLFDFAHEYLWEALIMLDAMVAFGLWVRFSAPKLVPQK